MSLLAVNKPKETHAVDAERLGALERLLTYAAEEAKKIGSPFVSYCVTLARDSVIAEIGERGMTIPTESLASLPADRAAAGRY